MANAYLTEMRIQQMWRQHPSFQPQSQFTGVIMFRPPRWIKLANHRHAEATREHELNTIGQEQANG